MSFNSDSVVYHRRANQKVNKVQGREVSRFVFAYGSEKMDAVMKWKVDTGGGKTASFAPAVQYAVYQTLAYNAQMFFGKKPEADFVGQLTTLLLEKKGHMSLYGFVDAIESLMSHEPPCEVEQYGFDAKAIMRACDLYWNRARDEYYAFEKTITVNVDYQDAVPMPEKIKEVRERLEQKFGVVYDEDSAKEQHRKAQVWFEGQEFK